MQYKKTYAGFVIWLVIYLAILMLLSIVPGLIFKDDIEAHMDLYIRIIDNAGLLLLLPLLYYIYRTGYIYLFSGMTYERACEAGIYRCKSYARRHLLLFGGFAIASLILSGMLQILHQPWWVDFSFFCIGLVAICVRAMFFKL